MATIKSWISALRPRTLFLATATTLCGSGLAYSKGAFNLYVCLLTILTATILQLLSNLANDLGDYQHGTDITGERVGPKRTVQSGVITQSQMKTAITLVVILAAIAGSLLVFFALRFMKVGYILFFLALGCAGIIAAIKYTSGKNPYGYQGFGDIFSFIFFGPVSTIGTYFLHVRALHFLPALPSIGLGLLTVAVLNLNNMRDIDNDRKSGKMTLAVRLGLRRAKWYHAFIISGAFASFLLFSIIYTNNWYQSIYMLVFLFFFKLLRDIVQIKENFQFDPYLKYTSIGAFVLSCVFCICINLT